MAWPSRAMAPFGPGATTMRGRQGMATSNYVLTPVQVVDPTDPSGYLTQVVAITGGEFHSLALKSNGTVVAWGYNGFGQLGNGTTANSSVPVPVSGLSAVISISGGSY